MSRARLIAGCAALLALFTAGSASAQISASQKRMASSILVHITSGPNDPTRAALGFAVAKAALDDGHRVAIFLAGDGVQLIRESVISSLSGLGTGNLRELHDAVVARGGRFYVSGGSSKARGVTQEDLRGKPAEFAGPPELVKLAVEYERVITY